MALLRSRRSLNDRKQTVANWFFTNLIWELRGGRVSDFSAPGRPRWKVCCRSTGCRLHRTCSSCRCSHASRKSSECQKAWRSQWATGIPSRFDDILVVYREPPVMKPGFGKPLSGYPPGPGGGIPDRQRKMSPFWDTLFLSPSLTNFNYVQRRRWTRLNTNSEEKKCPGVLDTLDSSPFSPDYNNLERKNENEF